MKILSLITEKPIAYYAVVKRIVGSTTAAIFLQQALYWWDKKHKEWLEKTVAEFEEETALTRWEQESSIKFLTAKGYLKHEKKGMPPKRRFYLNVDAIENALQIYVKAKEYNTRQDHVTYSGKTSLRKEVKPRYVTRQDHDSIYKESENTTENTTETSTNVEGASPPTEGVVKGSSSNTGVPVPLPPSSATPPSQPSYGNADVNAVLDYLRAVIGLTDFAEPVSEQRKWATHIARLGKAIGSEEFQTRLQALLDDPFKRKKLNKTAGIYYEIKGFIPEKLPGVTIQ